MARRGFTLIELLIVVSVIALLAGLLLPAIGMVRTAANKAKCGNNMRNIAIAVIAYRSDNNDVFPGRFSELVSGYNLPLKVLICPADASKGMNPNMGRLTNVNWGDYSRLWTNQIYNTFLPTGAPASLVTATSYCYECSGTIDPNGVLLTSDDIGYFYRDLTAAPDHSYASPPDPAVGTVSWADAKLHQVQFGNIGTSNGYGNPFPPGNVPMIRCYDHWTWDNNSTPDQLATVFKVINISMEGNLLFSSPYWEHDANPGIAP